MAEVDFDSFDAGAAGSRSARLSRMINLAGAASSIALVIGLGIWGYKLAVRDVNGVPVIRALAGPMREMAQAPGGDVASHQGLSVNAVAAVGIAAALPDQLLLAPKPVDLTAEDAPGLGVQQTAILPVTDPATLPQAEVGTSLITPVALTSVDPAPATVQTSDTDAAVALALADALAVGAEPFADLADAEPNDLAAAPAVRPRPRPAAAVVTEADATPETASVVPTSVTTLSSASGPVGEIDPATLDVGTRLVQLGAFDTEDEARAEWTRLQGRFVDLLVQKAMVVQAAQSGGRTFYRLRAHGFAGEDDARQFCAALVAENTPCIPALHR